MTSGFSGLPKFKQSVKSDRTRADASEIARRLGHRQHAADVRIEIAVAAVAVDGQRQAFFGALDADHRGIGAGSDHACWCGQNDRTGDRSIPWRRCSATPSSCLNAAPRSFGSATLDKIEMLDLILIGRPRRRPLVDRRFFGQRADRNPRHFFAVPKRAKLLVVGHPADHHGVEIPFIENFLDLAFAALLGHQAACVLAIRRGESRRASCRFRAAAPRERSNSMPQPPRPAISADELVRPAAPMS